MARPPVKPLRRRTLRHSASAMLMTPPTRTEQTASANSRPTIRPGAVNQARAPVIVTESQKPASTVPVCPASMGLVCGTVWKV